MKGRAGKLESEQPEAYRAILAQEAEQRREIETNRVFKPHLKERLLTDFDHEEEHLTRLQRFFHEPDFGEWDKSNS